MSAPLMVDPSHDAGTPEPENTDPSPVRHDRADQPVSETLERFLRFIVERVPLERIEEVHAFTPLRQGTVETGVAVVAARVQQFAAPAPGTPEAAGGPVELDAAALSDAPPADAPPADAPAADAPAANAPGTVERHTVYTARYRLVIKGPERGKWEPDIKEEADAPLVTVATVVQGVQRRVGEVSDIIRFNATQVARALRVSLPAPGTPPTG